MGFSNSTPDHLPLQKVLPLIMIIIILLFFLPSARSIHFNYSNFKEQQAEIKCLGDAYIRNGFIELTKNQLDSSINGSIGRAIYSNPIHIWDNKTGNLTDFNTRFSFVIKSINGEVQADGLTFFLTPNASTIRYAGGKNLGIYLGSNSSENRLVAVEFDTFRNEWDPSSNHVGINVNSSVSEVTNSRMGNFSNGSIVNALVSYSASTMNLSVFLSYEVEIPVFGEDRGLSYKVDLRKILPEWVDVGFSASTGNMVELHQIHSWEFSSTLEASVVVQENSTSEVNSTRETGNGGVNSTTVISPNGEEPKKENGKKTGLVAGLVVVGAVLIIGLGGLVLFGLKKKKKKRDKTEKEGVAFDVEMDGEFERGTGPKRFSYSELALATRDFSEDGKLGEGGFGGVYRGFLSELNLDVAVKRVSRDSQQGKKEYISEVKIISRLRHRNLVQLLGWCHERGSFALVYEFMPNGSLDSHLFKGKGLLGWPVRYKIATGLASALLYLHEEWEQCVVHRDIKSSNVMLDSNFNAKLGDFGLARLVDHEHGLETTVLAGTRGYLAPECFSTGKASKESDVYSFGVVALEIACGRRPVEPKAEESKVLMVAWVWELYGRGMLLDAADERLDKKFDKEQMEKLMVLGLWCAHPDYNLRPSIRQVIGVLNLEAPLPTLPSKMPVPMYVAPPMNPYSFSSPSSAYDTNLDRDRSQFSGSSHTTSSNFTSSSTSSTSALLR